MGLLTDFFLASSEELDLLDLGGGPAGRLPTTQAKGFDPVSLASLEARLTGVSEAEVDQSIVKEHADVAVLAVSQAFRDAIATMSGETLEQFGDEWLLSSDEVGILYEVAELARLGKRDGKSLYVWISP